MALLATEDGSPVPCAAVFTQNKFVAPPVELDRATLARQRRQGGGGHRQFGQRQCRDRRAGLQGRAADGRGDRRSAADREFARAGLLDRDHRHAAADGADPAPRRRGSRRSCRSRARDDAARGILTTDHKPKQVVIKGSTFTLGGMAKGCGMIAPNMATMLAFLTTDADVPRSLMQKALKAASDATFNTLNVDGATSTNDTAMLLASGRRGKADPDEFANARARRVPRPDDADGARRRRA